MTNETTPKIARVAIAAHIYVSIPIDDSDTEEIIFKRAADVVHKAEETAEYLELSEGFSSEHDATVYPARDRDGISVSIVGASIEDVAES